MVNQWLERLTSEVELNTEKNNSPMKASSFDKLKRISVAINTLKKEHVISFLSRCDLIQSIVQRCFLVIYNTHESWYN